jgi:hypothetical protein
MTKDAAPDFVTTFPYILAPFVSTPPDVVERMLVLANTGGDDFVFDTSPASRQPKYCDR